MKSALKSASLGCYVNVSVKTSLSLQIRMDSTPKTLYEIDAEGVAVPRYTLRDEPHNGRPAWDMDGSIHHTMCWTPYDGRPDYGFWSLADLWNKDDRGQASGFVYNTPEVPLGDGPPDLPKTATASHLPPMGWWTRGRPWCGDRTSGGRQVHLVLSI